MSRASPTKAEQTGQGIPSQLSDTVAEEETRSEGGSVETRLGLEVLGRKRIGWVHPDFREKVSQGHWGELLLHFRPLICPILNAKQSATFFPNEPPHPTVLGAGSACTAHKV